MPDEEPTLGELDLAAERPAVAAFENPDKRGTQIGVGVGVGVLACLVIAAFATREGDKANFAYVGLGGALVAAAESIEVTEPALEEPPPKPEKTLAQRPPVPPAEPVHAAAEPGAELPPPKAIDDAAAASPAPNLPAPELPAPAAPPTPAPTGAKEDAAPEPPPADAPAELPGVADEPEDEDAPPPPKKPTVDVETPVPGATP